MVYNTQFRATSAGVFIVRNYCIVQFTVSSSTLYYCPYRSLVVILLGFLMPTYGIDYCKQHHYESMLLQLHWSIILKKTKKIRNSHVCERL